MTNTFKIVVKKSETKYDLNPKTHLYEYKMVDYVSELETFELALEEFLNWVNDEYLEHKVSLIITPEKSKSKKK